jgi:plastocyanin
MRDSEVVQCHGAIEMSNWSIRTARPGDEDGRPLDETIDLRDAVVYFNPEQAIAVDPPSSEVLLTTARRQFEPRVVVVEAGSVVRFPNEDPILHNVFSSSPGNRFDLGLYGKSEGLTHRFDEPGLVRVFCNVHSRMSAHIVVVDTPFHLRPDGDGRFRFDALPRGRGTLTAWHERTDPLQIPVTIGTEDLVLAPIALRATVRQIAPQRERLRRRRRRY